MDGEFGLQPALKRLSAGSKYFIRRSMVGARFGQIASAVGLPGAGGLPARPQP